MKGQAILCVDDERIILSGLKDQLRRHFDPSLVIETAETGQEGLDAFEELREDGLSVPVVISDQMMPGMSGEAFLAEIHKRDPGVLSILLTGQATAEAVGAAVNTARLYRFVAKPWSEADLVMTVREAMKAWESAREIEAHQDALRTSHEASLRFVPQEVLRLLGHERVADVRYGDHIEREMNILFADMRGYTSLVEGKGPAESFQLINDYMQLMDAVIQEHGGFIGNIEGDAVLALFPNSASETVRAGVEAHHRLRAHNAQRAAKGDAPIRMGLGVNTGHLLLGTIGGEDRLQVDVVGDPVNLCSRVESLTKLYATAMLTTDATADRLDDEVSLRRVDRVRAKGRAEPVTLFEVLDALPADKADRKRRTAEAFGAAREAFEAGDLDAAGEGFEAVLELDPHDGAAQLHAIRCRSLQERGLPEDWDGITTLTRK